MWQVAQPQVWTVWRRAYTAFTMWTGTKNTDITPHAACTITCSIQWLHLFQFKIYWNGFNENTMNEKKLLYHIFTNTCKLKFCSLKSNLTEVLRPLQMHKNEDKIYKSTWSDPDVPFRSSVDGAADTSVGEVVLMASGWSWGLEALRPNSCVRLIHRWELAWTFSGEAARRQLPQPQQCNRLWLFQESGFTDPQMILP